MIFLIINSCGTTYEVSPGASNTKLFLTAGRGMSKCPQINQQPRGAS